MFAPFSSPSVVSGAAAPRWAGAAGSTEGGARLSASLNPSFGALDDPAAVAVEISAAARTLFAVHQRYTIKIDNDNDKDNEKRAEEVARNPEDPPPDDTIVRAPETLSAEERRHLARMRAIDAAVRAHEQAHLAAAGRYGAAPRYTFTTGPDNRLYAMASEVALDAAPVPDNPRATIEKMRLVMRAALAPSNPSGGDLAVYTRAVRNELEARKALDLQL